MPALLDRVNQLVSTAMQTRKGVNVNLEWERDCKTRKSCADIIRKRTRTLGRLGLDYNNLQTVQELRELGELPDPCDPIWKGKGQWDIFPYVIRHVVTNQLYLRLYTGTNENYTPEVQYYRNGVHCDFSDISDFLLASEHHKDLKTGTFCVKLEDMVQIGAF